MSDIQPAFWRRTPPALFPCILGLLGLGLAWRRAVALGAPSIIAEVICALAGAIFLLVFACYLAKLLRRPRVLLEDLGIPPARAAVSAGSMCWMAFAGIIGPYSLSIGQSAWVFGLGLHGIYLACVIRALWTSRIKAADVTPALLLPFVGYIVAALTGPVLGFAEISKILLAISLIPAELIALISIWNLLRRPVAQPDRASFAILIAPASIYAICAVDAGFVAFFPMLFYTSLFIAAALILAAKPMTKGGFIPTWGAFTFTSAIFASMLLQAATFGDLAWVKYVAWLSLLAASGIVPFVALRTFAMWRSGTLAKATKAAIA